MCFLTAAVGMLCGHAVRLRTVVVVSVVVLLCSGSAVVEVAVRHHADHDQRLFAYYFVNYN